MGDEGGRMSQWCRLFGTDEGASSCFSNGGDGRVMDRNRAEVLS